MPRLSGKALALNLIPNEQTQARLGASRPNGVYSRFGKPKRKGIFWLRVEMHGSRRVDRGRALPC